LILEQGNEIDEKMKVNKKHIGWDNGEQLPPQMKLHWRYVSHSNQYQHHLTVGILEDSAKWMSRKERATNTLGRICELSTYRIYIEGQFEKRQMQ
jgi:hypothetical protein